MVYNILVLSYSTVGQMCGTNIAGPPLAIYIWFIFGYLYLVCLWLSIFGLSLAIYIWPTLGFIFGSYIFDGGVYMCVCVCVRVCEALVTHVPGDRQSTKVPRSAFLLPSFC